VFGGDAGRNFGPCATATSDPDVSGAGPAAGPGDDRSGTHGSLQPFFMSRPSSKNTVSITNLLPFVSISKFSAIARHLRDISFSHFTISIEVQLTTIYN
jgi:hypothetical protein